MSLVGSTHISEHRALVLGVSPPAGRVLGCGHAGPAGRLPCLAWQRLLEETVCSKFSSL